MRNTALLFTSAALCTSPVPANAISWSTQINCATDYYAYCSMHVAGSAGCHSCMRTNRAKLSNACVSALIDDGILPKTESAQPKVKLAETKAPVVRTAVAKRVPSAPSVVANTTPSKRPTSIARPSAQSEPEPQQRPVEAALAIDQQTFEAFKNRAPYFLPATEFEATASNALPE